MFCGGGGRRVRLQSPLQELQEEPPRLIGQLWSKRVFYMSYLPGNAADSKDLGLGALPGRILNIYMPVVTAQGKRKSLPLSDCYSI